MLRIQALSLVVPLEDLKAPLDSFWPAFETAYDEIMHKKVGG